MPLSDAAVRNAKPRAKPYKLGDFSGLYLQVQPNGSKLWRMKYRLLGKEKKMSIGPYPEISLSEARRRRDKAREQLHSGLDPSREKVKARQHAEVIAGCTFTMVAEEYCAKRKRDGALLTPQVTHYGAIVEPEKVGELLRAIDGYDGFGITRQALLLAAHVFVRPGELRHAIWSEINFEERVWTIPPEKMKMRKAHHVPLSRQVIATLEELKPVTGPRGYVFPSVRSRARPMSENTLNSGLRRLGYRSEEMTGHGFRAMASTLLNESGKWSSDAIERALAHGDKDKVRAAYHRGQHWKERVEMAQWWSDHLDKLRDTVNAKSMRSRLARAA